jgi:plastocyanin
MKIALSPVLALAAASAIAADLQVTVATASGRPAPDVVVVVVPAGGPGTAAPASVEIIQKDNRFEPYVTAVSAGTTVRFVNRDRYDHHVRSLGSGPLGAVPPAKSFELRLPPGSSAQKVQDTVLFDTPGAVTLGCHIHGSMRGHLFIAASPHVAVTDEFGRATLRGLPDGGAELRLWHPDQITGQSPQALTLGGATTAKAALSFNPPRRPQPRPKSDYD